MPEISLDFTKIKLVRLDKHMDKFNKFENRKSIMIKHFRTRVSEDQKSKLGATWAWVHEDGTVIGFITIAMFSMIKSEISRQSDAFEDSPYQTVPALLVRQLATHKDYEGRGIGKFMTLWAIDQARQYSEKIGCRLVVGHPLDDMIEWHREKIGYRILKLKNGRNIAYFDLLGQQNDAP